MNPPRYDGLVLVGLVGAGKTRLARDLATGLGYQRVDFDARWHGDGAGTTTVEAFVDDLAATLNHEWRRRDVVVDGWWTWTARWWETREDRTLETLRFKATEHRVRVAYLPLDPERAFAAYRAKKDAGLYPPFDESGAGVAPELSDPEVYRASLPARVACLERRLVEAAAWAR